MTPLVLLLFVNCLILAIGNSGGPMIMRLYYLHGGGRIWFASWLETGGWPVILVPIVCSYMLRRRWTQPGSTHKLFSIKRQLFLGSAIIGLLTGIDDYFYAYGLARLPVSTASLIIASQLAFTAGFAYILVRQRFTSYSIIAVFLLMIRVGVLAFHSSSDRPVHESNKDYVLGFVMTIAAAALYGLILVLVELMYKRANQPLSYALVMEIQMVMSFFATAVCTVGMLVNHIRETRLAHCSSQHVCGYPCHWWLPAP